MNIKTTVKMRVSDLGELNPMPDIKDVNYIHAGFVAKPSVSDEEKRYLGKGMISTMIPYLMQDEYNRDKKEQDVNVIILENDKLKATFLPDYGARLWSLYDKKQNKELLYVNSVVQPCNLALRNAWLSGGIEFNLGIKGHSPLTCDKMFCDFIGDDAVRFYEYERIRGLAYSITAYLPEGAEALVIKIRVENTKDQETYMYWWTNIAVPETSNTRVIVPTNDSIRCLYKSDHYEVDKQAIPYVNGDDVSYPLQLGHSADYFYKIDSGHDKWEAAVDKNGYGLLEYSDRRLVGRKLFLWGKNQGGRHWSEWLSEKGQSYIEIQAGLAYTQLEHIPMPAKTVWEWSEAFTAIDGLQEDLYGDWDSAIKCVENQFENKVKLGACPSFNQLNDIKICGDVKTVYNASGWGDLENKLRTKFGKAQISNQVCFNRIENKETEDWYSLLEKGYLPDRDAEYVPASYVAGELWEKALEQSLENPLANNWFTYLHYGVCAYANGKIEKAMKLWEKSIELKPSIWAYRNLGSIYTNELGDSKTGINLLEKALAMKTGMSCVSLLKDFARMTTSNKQDQKWIDIYEKLDRSHKARKRLQVYLAIAHLNLGNYQKPIEIITPDFVLNDVKEMELSLSQIWEEMYTKKLQDLEGLTYEQAQDESKKRYPIPYEIDFRMHG